MNNSKKNMIPEIFDMWKEAAEKNPVKPNQEPIYQKKLNSFYNLFENNTIKGILKKLSPEEVARRIFNNSKNKRRFL